MNTTDAALAWLLSLSATCTSSPFRPSSPADYTDNDTFTDWLHLSSSPTRPSSSPLQDVSSSSCVNHPQDQNSDIFLPYNDGFRDMFNSSDPVHAPWHQAANAGGTSISALSTSDTTSLILTHQDQVFPLDSSNSTLVNSPSPRSLVNTFLSPSASTNHINHHLAHAAQKTSSLPLNPPTFASPASKLTNELAISPFGSYLNLYDPSTTFLALPSLSFSDVSPVVRASCKTEDAPLIDKENEVTKKWKKNKARTRTSKMASSSFLEKLQSAPANLPTTQHQPVVSPRPLPAHLTSNLDLLDGASSERLPVLLSPVKLQSSSALSPVTLDISSPISSPPEPCIIPAPVFTTPPAPDNAFISPLSPLTPLSSPEPSQPLKIKIVLKRKNTEPTTPIRRTKRPRLSHNVTVAIDPSSPMTSPPASIHEAEPENPRSVYTNRTLPTDIEISPDFPLLYRRFPASTYYQPPDADSPCTLFGLAHPGGNYNPPRRVFDLYTPRFVKGRGVEKVGLCPICIEPVSRGGEHKRHWLAMKFSAFNYHMQYAHGISASTGKPFSPPTAFRFVRRQNVGKNEKYRIQEGKCHKCSRWVVVEGVKDMESKVPELYWWKHAATCHHDSTLEGEGDYFEEDDVYDTLVSFEQPDA